MVNPALAVAVHHEKSTIRRERHVGRLIFFRLGIFAARLRIVPGAQHLAVQRQLVDLMAAVVRHVEDFLAILHGQREAVRAGVFRAPLAQQLPRLVIDDDVVLRVVRQQEDPPVLHLHHRMAILHRGFRIQHAPVRDHLPLVLPLAEHGGSGGRVLRLRGGDGESGKGGGKGGDELAAVGGSHGLSPFNATGGPWQEIPQDHHS